MGNEYQKSHILRIRQKQSDVRIILEHEVYSIGRHEKNSIVIPSKFISRMHALLVRLIDSKTGQTRFKIIDGNQEGRRSINGIAVNGKICTSHLLENGDKIRLGCTIDASYEAVPIPTSRFFEYLNYQKVNSQENSIKFNNSRQTLTDSHLCKIVEDDFEEDHMEDVTELSSERSHQKLCEFGSWFDN